MLRLEKSDVLAWDGGWLDGITHKSKYKKGGVLPIRIVKSNVSSIGPSSERNRANARKVRLYYPYWQYTDLFIFRFVSLLCLRSTLRLFHFGIHAVIDFKFEV